MRRSKCDECGAPAEIAVGRGNDYWCQGCFTALATGYDLTVVGIRFRDGIGSLETETIQRLLRQSITPLIAKASTYLHDADILRIIKEHRESLEAVGLNDWFGAHR